MLIKDYFADNKVIFDLTSISALTPNLFNATDITVLNDLFLSKFETCKLGNDTEAYNKKYAAYIIFKNKALYDGVKKALDATIDPFELSNIEEILSIEGEEVNEKEGKEKNKRTANLTNTRTPNITNTETPGAYTENQNRTFDDAVMSTHEKVTNGGTNTIVQTGTETNAQTGTDENEISFTDRKDTKSFNDRTDTRTKVGFDGIDYRKALEDYYETKRVNLFEMILNDVADELVIPIYEF